MSEVDALTARAEQLLTPAEREVWQLESRGMSQRAIAAALGISRSAVRDRLESAARRLARPDQEPTT